MMRNTVGREAVAGLLEEAGAALGFSGEGWKLQPIVADGSDREFYRVRRGATHYVALVSPSRVVAGIDECDAYYLIGCHLRSRGLPVPQFLWADRERGLFLLEDFGDCHMQTLARRRRAALEPLYRRVLALLVRVHRLAPEGFEPRFCFDSLCYDAPFVYARELEYFRRAFLVNYLGLDTAEDDLRADFEQLAEAAGVRETELVIHRDFQSRNLMVHGGRLWLVDFQGMRYGPPAYDLASVLLDPYTALPPPLQDHLADLYYTAMGKVLGGSRSRFFRRYTAVRLARNLQVLGAYSHLAMVKGKRQFLQYIPRAFRELRRWLHGPCRDRWPRLQQAVARAATEHASRLRAVKLSEVKRRPTVRRAAEFQAIGR